MGKQRHKNGHTQKNNVIGEGTHFVALKDIYVGTDENFREKEWEKFYVLNLDIEYFSLYFQRFVILTANFVIEMMPQIISNFFQSLK